MRQPFSVDGYLLVPYAFKLVYVFLVPHLSLRMVDLNVVICVREMLRGFVWSCGVNCGFWLGVVGGLVDGVGLEVCVCFAWNSWKVKIRVAARSWS